MQGFPRPPILEVLLFFVIVLPSRGTYCETDTDAQTLHRLWLK